MVHVCVRERVCVLALLQGCISAASNDHACTLHVLTCTPSHSLLAHTDFGISKFMKPGETTDEFMGTPTYMVSASSEHLSSLEL